MPASLHLLLAIYVLFRSKTKNIESDFSREDAFNLKLLSTTFALPLIGIFLGQLFRGEFTANYYDSPAHIFVGIFVMWALVIKSGERTVEYVSYTFPLVTILGLANVLINPNLHWGASRLSTQAIDPLMLGSLSLTFGVLSLLSIKLHLNHSRLLLIYKLIGFCTGVYLSILSGSRTGWLALPIITGLWIYYDHKKLSINAKVIAISFISIVLISSYFVSSNIQQRADETYQQVLAYEWNSKSHDDYNSVGARISFARIASVLFQQKPLSGWGDGNFESALNDPALRFSKLETKKLALGTGFHNDITANMVRSGIWGLTATVALFLIPALFFMCNLRSPHKNKRDVAFIALAFLIFQFVSSMSMEIFNLRYSASFFGLMLAIFCGQILFYSTHNTSKSTD